VASVIEVEGETIDDAIERGLHELGIDREHVQVEILQDARKGLLGFGGQQARVRLTRREAEPDAVAVRRDPSALDTTEPRRDDGGTVGGATRSASEALERILDLMDIEAKIEGAENDDGQAVLRITSPSGGILIGRHGQTLEALEYLVNRIAAHQEDRGARILLDVGDYRERRKRELEDNARRLAEKVRRMHRPESMNPMSARERRIVHMALAETPGVVTSSTGEGHLRRVVISPSRNPRHG
jgi:spoIIIJ-associated protein